MVAVKWRQEKSLIVNIQIRIRNASVGSALNNFTIPDTISRYLYANIHEHVGVDVHHKCQ